MPLILPNQGRYELEEKRSRFIGLCAPVKTEAEARQFISDVRTAEKGANHNVFAYSVREGNMAVSIESGLQAALGNAQLPAFPSLLQPISKRNAYIIRFSDDGEPGGTAGMPVLNVFDKTGVVDYVCVVTRYFGGTLLGAGGLVRAYTKAAKGALDAAGPTKEVYSKLYRVDCEYGQFDRVKYNFDKWGVEILDIQYTEKCTLYVKVLDELAEPFLDGAFYEREEIV